MEQQKIAGDFAVPELIVGSDGYGGFDVSYKLTGAKTCDAQPAELEDAERDMSSLEASVWFASVVPIGKPDTPERAEGMKKLAEVLRQYKEDGLAVIDNWIQELQAVREQLVNEPVRLEEVERVEDVIDV